MFVYNKNVYLRKVLSMGVQNKKETPFSDLVVNSFCTQQSWVGIPNRKSTEFTVGLNILIGYGFLDKDTSSNIRIADKCIHNPDPTLKKDYHDLQSFLKEEGVAKFIERYWEEFNSFLTPKDHDFLGLIIKCKGHFDRYSKYYDSTKLMGFEELKNFYKSTLVFALTDEEIDSDVRRMLGGKEYLTQEEFVRNSMPGGEV